MASFMKSNMATFMARNRLSTIMKCNLFSTNSRVFVKYVPDKMKKRKASSQKWLIRQHTDPYVQQVLERNYRCRSAFKLIEMDDKFGFLKPGSVVIDCGAAPGSWSQVAAQRTHSLDQSRNDGKGLVIAIDILDMEPIRGVEILKQMDFTEQATQDAILDVLAGRTVDSVISDMAPNASGHKSLDQELIMDLAWSSFRFSQKVLKPGAGSTYLVKLWDNSERQNFQRTLGKYFDVVKQVKPPASRSDSSEIYVYATGLKKS